MSEISKQALKVDNNTSFPNNNTGYISPSILRAFNVNMIDSLVDEIGYTADSASWNVSIGQLNTYTSSFAPSLTQLNAFTASQLVVNSNLNQFTQSAGASITRLDTFSSSFNAYTASINQIRSNGVTLGNSTIFNFVGPGTFFSASLVQNIQGNIATLTFSTDNSKLNTSSFNDYTASEAAIFTAYSQSVSSSIKVINEFTASANVSIAALNAYTASDDVSIDLLNAFTASQNILNTTFATTGSNQFIGNQVITGSVTISSSATYDLIITGAARIVNPENTEVTTLSSTVLSVNTTKSTNAASLNIFGSTGSNATFYLGVYDDPNFTTDTELLVDVDGTNGIQFKDWDNGSTFSYVPFITVEPNLGNNPAPVFTRGLVVTGSAAIQNLNVSGSVVISGSTSLRGNLTQNTGSITAFGNVRTTNGVFTSSINGGLEIDGLGYVGSGSAGAFFIGTTTQDLKIQNWYSSSVDGKNIVIENFSPTGSNPIFGKVALRARGEGGAVTVENTSQFRVECKTEVTGAVYGNIIPLSITNNTASMNLTGSNFFTLNLVSGSVTRLEATNVKGGQTINLLVTQPNIGSGSLTYGSQFKFAPGNQYTASANSGSQDILTFITFNTSSIFASAIKGLI